MTKECVHTQLFKAQEVKIDFTQDSEYKKCLCNILSNETAIRTYRALGRARRKKTTTNAT
jgi:hypothetical protein